MAVSPEGAGRPVKIHLQSKVIKCDPTIPSIELANGQSIDADLVVGADGVHVSFDA